MGRPMSTLQLWCWRHPRARAAAGRCIGHTDLRADPRKARRLARRIRTHARRYALARTVWVSPLERARCVGRELRRLGFRVHVDARLAELDFGNWDGLRWDRIERAAIDAWAADLGHHKPGGGECLQSLWHRVRAFIAEAGDTRLVVTHGGWINALRQGAMFETAAGPIAAASWPQPPAHGECVYWERA
jgi:alpha-ribazole phosphatase